MIRAVAAALLLACAARAQDTRAVDTRPTRAEALARARAFVDQKSFKEAAPWILVSLGIDAQAVPALAIAARGFAEGGDRRTARGLLQVAVHLDPGRVDLLRMRAALSLDDGDAQDAHRDAEAVLAREPADVEARILRARALYALGRAMDARDALASLDRVSPLEPALARVLATLDLEARLLDAAESRFVRLGPLRFADVEALARAWLEGGDPRRALQVIAGVAAGMTPDLLRLRARAHAELGEWADAESELRGIEAPTDADELALAGVKQMQGDLATASRVAGSVLARDPANVAARVRLIGLLLAQGDVSAAHRMLEEGLVLLPHHPELVRAIEDLVPELAQAERIAPTAVLSGEVLTVDGATLAPEAADAVAQLRKIRRSLGGEPPVIRLILAGTLDARVVRRAFDLLAAAGFSRVAVESREP